MKDLLRLLDIQIEGAYDDIDALDSDWENTVIDSGSLSRAEFAHEKQVYKARRADLNETKIGLLRRKVREFTWGE